MWAVIDAATKALTAYVADLATERVTLRRKLASVHTPAERDRTERELTRTIRAHESWQQHLRARLDG